MTFWVTPRLTKVHDILGNPTSQMVIGVRQSPKAAVTRETYTPVGAFAAACYRDLEHHENHDPGDQPR